MKTLPLLCALALVAPGCGGSDSTEPLAPDVSGTYRGAFTVTASSSAANQNFGTIPATAIVNQQGSRVSIAIVNQGSESFTFDGTITRGGAITLDGEPDLSILQAGLPQCSFTGAIATNSASVMSGTFVATVTVVGASCPWQQANGAFLPTSFQIRFEGA